MTNPIAPASPRRKFLRKVAAAGAVGAVGVAASPRAAGAARGRTERLALDVAIKSTTFTMIPAPGSAPPVHGYGTTFIVEGDIFAGGALPDGDIDTSDVPVVGTWFCRGWFVNKIDRPNPHILSTQDFIFSTDLMHPDTIVTSGVEGNDEPGVTFHRAVTSGTGLHAGVTGETTYHSFGTNQTLGANLRYDFDLVHPRR